MKTEKEHSRVYVDSGSYVHAYVTRPISTDSKRTLFVFSHGFSVDGTESYRLFIELSGALLSLGYPSILFDYRGSGYSDLAFEDMTFDTELADLNAVVNFAREEFPDHHIALWGMSFGCAVTACVASQRSDISFMVLWCLSAELHCRYRKRLGVEIEERGYTYIDKGFKVKREFLESLKGRDVYAAIKDSSIPSLLVHGDADATASIELSRTAHKLAPDNTTLREIKGGNHGFKLQPGQYKEAVDITLDWIRQRSND
jgi:pimeloyl-ACP methyl ester carboxylesterase